MADTLGTYMDRTGNTRGFDYLRIVLALGVLGWHSLVVSHGSGAGFITHHAPFGEIKMLILPMFFALSGFLVSGSMDRCKTIEGFLTLRALRLVPALAVEVILSVTVIGMFFTTLPLSEYFFNSQTASYLLNIVGDIHYNLPGVFQNNRVHSTVNLSLWTVPYELECYLVFAAMTVTGVLSRKRIFTIAVIVLAIVAWALHLWMTNGLGSPKMTADGRLLVLSFLAGSVLYYNRHSIPLKSSLAWACGAISLALLYFDQTKWLVAFPAAYWTIWLGLLNPPKIPVLMDGDYSYGVYLFAFPIQQALASTTWGSIWFVNLIGATVLSFCYAAFSWHVVEKPVLSHRKAAVSKVEAIGLRVRKLVGKGQPASASS